MEFKPIRRLYQGTFWKVNSDWIKEEIVKISNLSYGKTTRKLIITDIKDNYSHEQTIFFSLEGSPSRGYAIFTGDNLTGTLCIISQRFDKKKVFKNIKLEL